MLDPLLARSFWKFFLTLFFDFSPWQVGDVIGAITLIATVVVAYKAAQATKESNKSSRETALMGLRASIENAWSQYMVESSDPLHPMPKPRLRMHVERILTSYESICILERDNIETEDFYALFGTEILELYANDMMRDQIERVNTKYPYLQKAIIKLQYLSLR